MSQGPVTHRMPLGARDEYPFAASAVPPSVPAPAVHAGAAGPAVLPYAAAGSPSAPQYPPPAARPAYAAPAGPAAAAPYASPAAPSFGPSYAAPPGFGPAVPPAGPSYLPAAGPSYAAPATQLGPSYMAPTYGPLGQPAAASYPAMGPGYAAPAYPRPAPYAAPHTAHPYATGGYPAARPADPDRVSPAAAFGIIALAVLVLGAVMAYLVINPTPILPPGTRSTQAAPTAPASTEPTAPSGTTGAPVPAQQPSTSSSREEQLLKANPIYAQTISGSCARQGIPSSVSQTKKVVSGYIDCLNALWQPRVVAAGYTFRPPSVQFFTGSISTACGRSPSTATTPGFYCPPEETIYIAESGVEMMQENRLFGVELIAHEYAHHVQRLTLVLDAVAVWDARYPAEAVSRRVELQAHCLAYAIAGKVTGYTPTSDELRLMRRVWQVPADPEGHGSPQAITLWGERGLAASSVKSCDTFSSPLAEVT